MLTTLAIRRRSGHSSRPITAATIASLTSPLTNSASARAENRRFRPRSGEIFSSLGLIGSRLSTKPLWIRPPARAATMAKSMGGASARARSLTVSTKRPRSPSPSTAIACGRAMKP